MLSLYLSNFIFAVYTVSRVFLWSRRNKTKGPATSQKQKSGLYIHKWMHTYTHNTHTHVQITNSIRNYLGFSPSVTRIQLGDGEAPSSVALANISAEAPAV